MKHGLPTASVATVLLTLAACRPSPSRPNFLLIITDDQRFDTMEFMPRTQARIFDQGVTFARGYVTTPICGPSRASMLTGKYVHTHGVADNDEPLLTETFVPDLQEAGYFTGIAGKYLNSWALVEDEPPRPEFDFWVAHGSPESFGAPEDNLETFYYAPWLNVDGTWSLHDGYATYVVRDYALDFLEEAGQRDQPFFLIFAPFAPHNPADPAPGDEDLYADLPPHRPPSFDEADISDKPDWLAKRDSLTPGEIEAVDDLRRRQLQTLDAVDRAVEELLDELEAQGKLDETVVFYLSDNGQYWGEHRLTGKRQLYEESVRVPFALRYPGLVSEPRVEPRLVANIDIAPTIYDLAGIPIPPEVDGRSLVPLLEGTDDWREDLMLEKEDARRTQAIHTDQYVYIETRKDRAELYDLTSDPYQLTNLSGDPEYAEIEAALKERLDAMRAEIEEKRVGELP